MWPQTNEIPDFSPSVPVAQEWSADLNRTLSRREKKKTADGVTLTGINQTGEQALQNKPSRWALGRPQSLERSPWSSARAGTPPPATPGDSPMGPRREPQGHLSRHSLAACALLGSGPRSSLERIISPPGARAAERSRGGAFATNVLWAPNEGKN